LVKVIVRTPASYGERARTSLQVPAVQSTTSEQCVSAVHAVSVNRAVLAQRLAGLTLQPAGGVGVAARGGRPALGTELAARERLVADRTRAAAIARAIRPRAAVEGRARARGVDVGAQRRQRALVAERRAAGEALLEGGGGRAEHEHGEQRRGECDSHVVPPGRGPNVTPSFRVREGSGKRQGANGRSGGAKGGRSAVGGAPLESRGPIAQVVAHATGAGTERR
jgi:hypothetical protein